MNKLYQMFKFNTKNYVLVSMVNLKQLFNKISQRFLFYFIFFFNSQKINKIMKLQHPVKIIRNQKELGETNPIIKKFEENKENVGTNK